MKTVNTPEAPAAVGPYSQAVTSGGFVFTSGQIPLEPETGELVAGGFEAEVRRALENLDAVLRAAGTHRSRVVKVTVFLTDMGRFGVFNGLYEEFFGPHRPARSVVEVAALPRGARVELEAVAEVS